MTAIDFGPVTLTRPSGKQMAKWIGRIGDTELVHVRFWKVDPNNESRFKPVETIARHCLVHKITFLTSDYPAGCPECQKHTGVV